MYKQELRLKDNQKVTHVTDLETGELQPIIVLSNNLPEGKEPFEPKSIFRKSFDITEEYLDKVLKPIEFRIVAKMCRLAKPNTNSLNPLNDDTTMTELAEEFGVHRNKVKRIFTKLFELGVYAGFEVVREDVGYTKYWVLNPYIRFQGSLINSDIRQLFDGTRIANHYKAQIAKNKIQ